MGYIYMLYFENIYKGAYIGQTKQRIQRRVAQHRATAIKNKTLKQRWINQNGRFNLKYLILYEGDNLDFNEIKFIEDYKKKGVKLYNITKGGSGAGSFGYKHTKEAKEKISLNNWGRDYSNYTFKNINGDIFTGNRLEFSKYSRLNTSIVSQLVRGEKLKRKGWYETNCINISGNKKPRNNKTYQFTHYLYGDENCTCWELIQKYNLDNSKIYMVVKGNRNHHKSWFLNYNLTAV